MDDAVSSHSDLHQAVLDEQINLLRAAMKKFRHCVAQLSDEQLWWRAAPGQNSVGNLIQHVCGNLTQWITCGMGGASDNRDRDAEFAADGGKTSAELSALLDGTIETVSDVIRGLSAQDLLAKRTIQGFPVSGLGAVIHSVTHFVGHTHQVIQLTRLQLGERYRFEWSPGTTDTSLPI